MKNIVISVKKNNELRQNHVANEFKKSNVEFEFFDAVTPDQILTTENELGINLSNSDISLGAKACLLSHAKVWQMTIQSNSKYVAIFEDDIHLSSSASTFLSDSKWIPLNADLIKLEKYSKYFPRFNFQKEKTLDNRTLYEIKKCNLGTAGYIISNEAARKLLNRLSSKQNILDIDVEMFTPELNSDLSVLMLNPAICIQDFILNNSKSTKFPSFIRDDKKTISTKKTTFMKIQKELSRFALLPVIKKHVISQKSTYR